MHSLPLVLPHAFRFAAPAFVPGVVAIAPSALATRPHTAIWLQPPSRFALHFQRMRHLPRSSWLFNIWGATDLLFAYYQGLFGTARPQDTRRRVLHSHFDSAAVTHHAWADFSGARLAVEASASIQASSDFILPRSSSVARFGTSETRCNSSADGGIERHEAPEAPDALRRPRAVTDSPCSSPANACRTRSILLMRAKAAPAQTDKCAILVELR